MKVSREEVAEIEFKDKADFSNWAADSIALATKRGLLNGRIDGTFDGKANLTRGEVAQILVNLMK